MGLDEVEGLFPDSIVLVFPAKDSALSQTPEETMSLLGFSLSSISLTFSEAFFPEIILSIIHLQYTLFRISFWGAYSKTDTRRIALE